MTTRPLKLEVITPDRVVLSDRGVVSVTAPGSEGYLGVLANHAPLMTELAIGELDFRRADGTEESMAVAGGVMEVHENKVTVLAEIAELRANAEKIPGPQARAKALEVLAKTEAEFGRRLERLEGEKNYAVEAEYLGDWFDKFVLRPNQEAKCRASRKCCTPPPVAATMSPTSAGPGSNPSGNRRSSSAK